MPSYRTHDTFNTKGGTTLVMSLVAHRVGWKGTTMHALIIQQYFRKTESVSQDLNKNDRNPFSTSTLNGTQFTAHPQINCDQK